MSETTVVAKPGREKQVESMKARWQNPEYRANVAAGRAAKKAAKEAAKSAEQPQA